MKKTLFDEVLENKRISEEMYKKLFENFCEDLEDKKFKISNKSKEVEKFLKENNVFLSESITEELRGILTPAGSKGNKRGVKFQKFIEYFIIDLYCTYHYNNYSLDKYRDSIDILIPKKNGKFILLMIMVAIDGGGFQNTKAGSHVLDYPKVFSEDELYVVIWDDPLSRDVSLFEHGIILFPNQLRNMLFNYKKRGVI